MLKPAGRNGFHTVYAGFCGCLPFIYSFVHSFNKYEPRSFMCVLCLVAQPCLTLCDPMDCCPPGSSVHGDSLGKNTGAGCHALLQRIFPTQGSNPGLLYCRWILYQLSCQRSPKNLIVAKNQFGAQNTKIRLRLYLGGVISTERVSITHYNPK